MRLQWGIPWGRHYTVSRNPPNWRVFILSRTVCTHLYSYFRHRGALNSAQSILLWQSAQQLRHIFWKMHITSTQVYRKSPDRQAVGGANRRNEMRPNGGAGSRDPILLREWILKPRNRMDGNVAVRPGLSDQSGPFFRSITRHNGYYGPLTGLV